MKFSEVIAKAISLATAIRDYWDAELPKRHPHYPVVAVGEDSGPPPPDEQKLRDLLVSLPEDQIRKLALVMYLGRGDFDANSLAEQHANLTRRFAKPNWLVSQLMGKALLADYLSNGLAELKKHGLDVDRLDFTSVGTEA